MNLNREASEPKGMHKDLQGQLAKFNRLITNEYRDDWGSLLNYLPDEFKYMNTTVDEVFLAEKIRMMTLEYQADA